MSPRVLQPVGDADEFLSDPEWRVFRRNGYFCSAPSQEVLALFGMGHANSDDVEELLRLFSAFERVGFPRHRQLVVLRHVQSVSFAAMQRFMRYHNSTSYYLESVMRQAVVRPAGLVGVLAEGFYRTVGHQIDGRVFTSLAPACDFIGIDDADWLNAVLAEERAMLASAEGSLFSLATLWPRGYMRVTLEEAAAHLRVPVRTLQRRFAHAGLSFVEARLRAALDHAEERLLAGDEVKVIAYDCGFTSPAAFIAAFKRSRGAPPALWRERAR